ncbi:MAG TPA: hypothetical protein VNE71_14660, partial [Myxococcota bacterium]|nr:hypothetical protein [Myxococcota bacterium]
MVRACAALALTLAWTLPAAAESPRVARGMLRGLGEAGLAFFLPAPGKAGAVAVGAAHSFDATRLAEAGEVAFETAPGAAPAARSQRYYAKPGAAYHLPGSSPRGDYVVFALEAKPEGVTLLEPASTPPAPGTRVAILGFGEDALERTLPGTVEKSGAESITVDLDARADLR